MSIRTKITAPDQAPITPIAPTVVEPSQIKHPRIEPRPASESNGYLDPDQTLVNFAIRELGMSFEQLIADDPSRILRNWLKCYKAARSTAIATTALGAGAVLLGVGTGAMPLMIAGVATIGSSGFLIRHHNNGVQSCEIEASILDEIRPILELFHSLEMRGANPSDLVSLYDRLIRQYTAQNPALGVIGRAEDLKGFFEAELAKHQALSKFHGTPTGFVAAVSAPPQPVQQPAIAPAAESAPQPTPVVVEPMAELPAEDLWAEPSPVAAPTVIQTPTQAFPWEANPTSVPMAQRAEEVIRFLDGANFPIGVILNTPTTMGYGGSQSGKSTILHLAATLELAQGKKVAYCNPDGDIPPIRFTRLIEGGDCASALEFIEKLTTTISKAGKGQLAGGVAWIDEWYKIARYDRSQSSNDKASRVQALIDQILGKGDKTGIRIRGAAQVTTLDALGLSGISEAIGRDFLVVNALKAPATSYQKEQALGVYECDRGEGKERWITPDALKSVVRPDGSPDPVMSMLRWFPELRDESRIEAWMNPQTQTETVDNLLFVDFTSKQKITPQAEPDAEVAIERELSTKTISNVDSEVAEATQEEINKAIPAIIVYLRGKTDHKNLEDIYRSTPVRNALGGAKKSATQGALDCLITQQLVHTDGNGSYWASDVISPNNNPA